jgi:hypothetical protein
MTTARQLADATHSWRDVSMGAYGYVAHCTRCGMGEYEATGLVCIGTRSHACPTQSNAHTQGTCTRQFSTQREAQDHWTAEHRAAFSAR